MSKFRDLINMNESFSILDFLLDIPGDEYEKIIEKSASSKECDELVMIKKELDKIKNPNNSIKIAHSVIERIRKNRCEPSKVNIQTNYKAEYFLYPDETDMKHKRLNGFFDGKKVKREFKGNKSLRVEILSKKPEISKNYFMDNYKDWEKQYGVKLLWSVPSSNNSYYGYFLEI